MKTVLSVASNGGHLVQLMQLKPLFRKKNMVLVTTSPISSDVPYAVEIVRDINKNSSFREIAGSFVNSFRIMRCHEPDVVLSTGALPGLIFILVGRLLGIKTIWIDSIANVDSLSLSGKIAQFFSMHCFTQWKHLESKRAKFIGRVI